jgi:hypothetical protein
MDYLDKPVFLYFLVGGVLELVGLCFDYLSILPKLESLLLRSYVDMFHGYNSLDNNSILAEKSRGYKDIVRFIIKDLKKKRPEAYRDPYNKIDENRKLTESDIISLEGQGHPISYSGFPVGRIHKIVARYGEGKEDYFEVHTYAVKNELERNRRASIFKYQLFFWVCGSCIQLLGIISQLRM